MSARWQRIRAVFEAALGHEGADLERLLDERCGEDHDLRREVMALLREDRHEDSFLDRDNGALETLSDGLSLGLEAGARLGPWEVVSALDSGGMGMVYEGRRGDGQFDKKVAIKVIKPGMDSEEIIRRFEFERHVVAGLEHPGIARLLDGGATEAGRPYLVMEYVDGVPIDDFCREHELGLAERLRLFQEVCSAVSAAHRSLVVHRDLKPSNVLVDRQGRPRLLDFGIAKVLEPTTGLDPARTHGPGRAMTPEYASPEQVRGDRITTATDIYALGIMLYELLAGRRPFALNDSTWAEIEQTVLERTPTAPSSVAPKDIAGRLRGDLDNIVVKALAKEPERRYSSVEQLSDDLDRHLDGHPVRARPDTLRYRSARFVQRNRALVLSFIAIGAALALGLILTWQQYGRASEARDLAARRFAEVRGLARTILFDLDAVLQPIEGSTSAREFVVETGIVYLDGLAAEAREDAGLLLEVGNGILRIGDIQGGPLSRNLGRSADARTSYLRALEIGQQVLDAQPQWFGARELVALAHHRLGVLDENAGLLERALDRYQDAIVLLRDGAQDDLNGDAGSMLRGSLLTLQGSLVTRALRTGRMNEAVELAAEHVRMVEEIETPGDLERGELILPVISRFGHVLMTAGQAEAAEDSLLAALEQMRPLYDAHPDDVRYVQSLSFCLSNFGLFLRQQQQHQEALEVLGECVDLGRLAARADPDNAHGQRALFVALVHLGQALMDVRRFAETYQIAVEQVQVAELLIRIDPDSMRCRADLATARSAVIRALVTTGRATEALDECHQLVNESEALADQRPEEIFFRRSRASAYWDLGKVLRALSDDAEDAVDALAHLEDARDAFQTAVDAFRQLDTEGRLAPMDRPFIERWQGDVTTCTGKIEELRAQVDP